MSYNYKEITEYVKGHIQSKHKDQVHMIDDITQEVLIKVFKHQPRHWKVFCDKCCSTVIIDEVRIRKRENRNIYLHKKFMTIGNDEKEINDVLSDVIKNCPKYLRLQYIEGKTWDQIARQMAVSRTTVYLQIKKEKDLMRKMMKL